MVFLIDGSGSVGRSNFERELAFIADVCSSDKLAIGEKNVQVGIVVYSKSIGYVATLDQFKNASAIAEAVLSTENPIDYPSSMTYTGRAFRYAKEMLLTGEGARDDVPKMIVVVTDGKSNGDLDAAHST
eukprot:GABW01001183.1.p1 GENE.GABW01001183.1~~GABW01001183.1.p1  ORF type:complete len:129 (-),score=36.83 GABW01001183.1:3-389(-)